MGLLTFSYFWRTPWHSLNDASFRRVNAQPLTSFALCSPAGPFATLLTGRNDVKNRGATKETRKQKARQAATAAAETVEDAAGGENRVARRKGEAATTGAERQTGTAGAAATTTTTMMATTTAAPRAPRATTTATEAAAAAARASDAGVEGYSIAPAKAKRERTGGNADGKTSMTRARPARGGAKALEALLLLGMAATPDGGGGRKAAEGCAVRVPRGKAVVVVETAAVASQTTTMVQGQERAGTPLLRAERGVGDREGKRALVGGGSRAGAPPGEVVAIAKGDGAPLEEEGTRETDWWRLRCRAAGCW